MHAYIDAWSDHMLFEFNVFLFVMGIGLIVIGWRMRNDELEEQEE